LKQGAIVVVAISLRFMYCAVVIQGANGWGDREFEVEAILDRTVSEVWYQCLCLYFDTCIIVIDEHNNVTD